MRVAWVLGWVLGSAMALAAEPPLGPRDVFVVANRRSAESKFLAEYYCKQRNIPTDHILLVDVRASEIITRVEYDRDLRGPLRELLKSRRDQAKVLVTMFDVPLRVEAPILSEQDTIAVKKLEVEMAQVKDRVDAAKARLAQLEKEVRGKATEEQDIALQATRQTIKTFEGQQRALEKKVVSIRPDQADAAVDSELSLLWWENYPLNRWVPNLLHFQAPAAARKNSPPIVMVSRLDGPTVETVKRLIDDAIATENDGGPVGIVYVDARGLAYDPKQDDGFGYAGYDESMREMAALLEKDAKLHVRLDNEAALFPPSSCPGCSLYCGWYSVGNYIDSFRFVRGAVAWHLASFEMTTLRNPQTKEWCKNLLDNGVAATLGPVSEPYTVAFPKPAVFFGFLVSGELTLVECYYRSIHLNSWKLALVGDPLYRPFARQPKLKLDQVKPSPRGGRNPFDTTR